MKCDDCGSVNVVHVPHFWQGLPAESPLRARYAPPPAAEGGYLVALAAIVVGIIAAVSGAVMPGLLVTAGGVVWGLLVHHRVAAAEAALADWNSSRVCLACAGTF